jgi:hypothetical protein
MVPTNLKLDTSISGLLGWSLDTLIGRRTSPARGIEKEGKPVGSVGSAGRRQGRRRAPWR